jgi:hypothetical protein
MVIKTQVIFFIPHKTNNFECITYAPLEPSQPLDKLFNIYLKILVNSYQYG